MSAPSPGYDARLFGVLCAAGGGSALFCTLVSRIFSDNWRSTELFLTGAVLTLILSGTYTWLAAKQPDAAKLIPPGILLVVALFVPQDISEARENKEVAARFWNALPAYAAMLVTSATMVWRTWAPVLRRWAGKAPPPAEAAPRPSGKPKKKLKAKAKARPTPAPAPEVEPDVDEDEQTVDERVPEVDDEPTVDDVVRRPEITTGLPRRRKPPP